MPDAFDPATHREPLPSPCINLCVMEPHTGLCRGCLRTIDEIIGWSSANEQDKRRIWVDIATRRQSADGAT
ncbi:MAG: hypothetical protein NVSMB6_16120 [Burkholderiaceae bacterium]